MVCQTLKSRAAGEQITTRQIDVTGLTQSQSRELFRDCLNQADFTSFTKTRNGKQTIFTFTYQNEN